MKADLAHIHHSGLTGAPPLVTLTHTGAGLLLSIPPAASVSSTFPASSKVTICIPRREGKVSDSEHVLAQDLNVTAADLDRSMFSTTRNARMGDRRRTVSLPSGLPRTAL